MLRTAFRTPLPRYRPASPSRSSRASCSPVDAPLGTAARPVSPLASVTSASTVGLPRLSRISRAAISMIVDMRFTVAMEGFESRRLPALRFREPFSVRRCALADRSDEGNALHAVQLVHRAGHPLPRRSRQTIAVLVRHSRGGNGLEKMNVDDPGPNAERVTRHHLHRSVHDGRYDRHTRRNGQNERALLELAQRVALAARSLGEHDHRRAAANAVRGDAVGLERGFPILALDGDHPCGTRRATEDRNAKQLGLPDELVSRKHRREGENVEPADVVADEDAWRTRPHALLVMESHGDPRGTHEARSPPSRRIVVDTPLAIPYAEQRRQDH